MFSLKGIVLTYISPIVHKPVKMNFFTMGERYCQLILVPCCSASNCTEFDTLYDHFQQYWLSRISKSVDADIWNFESPCLSQSIQIHRIKSSERLWLVNRQWRNLTGQMTWYDEFAWLDSGMDVRSFGCLYPPSSRFHSINNVENDWNSVKLLAEKHGTIAVGKI